MIDWYLVILAVGVAAIIGILGYVRSISIDLNDLYWLIDGGDDQITESIEQDREKEEQEICNKAEVCKLREYMKGYQ